MKTSDTYANQTLRYVLTRSILSYGWKHHPWDSQSRICVISHFRPFSPESLVTPQRAFVTRTVNQALYVGLNAVLSSIYARDAREHALPSDAPMLLVLGDQPLNSRDHRKLLPIQILPWVLENELHGYDTKDVSYLIQGFTTGFKIPQTSPITGLHLYKNHGSAQRHHSETQFLIRKELETGRVAGLFKQPSFPNFDCSPIGLRPSTKVVPYYTQP